MIEEFFMSKHAKKLLDLSTALNDTGENVLHLLFRHAPSVPPKFVLKRKDLTKEILNALDAKGLSPVLGCSKQTLSKIFASKNVKGENYQVL